MQFLCIFLSKYLVVSTKMTIFVRNFNETEEAEKPIKVSRPDKLTLLLYEKNISTSCCADEC